MNDHDHEPDAGAAEETAAPIEATVRSFTLAESVEVDGEHQPVVAVQFGGNPRIVIAAGETFTTDDPAVAERCATHPLLTETDAPASTPRRRKRGGDGS